MVFGRCFQLHCNEYRTRGNVGSHTLFSFFRINPPSKVFITVFLTRGEIDIDTIHDLLHESIILQSSESQEDAINILRNLQRTYPQPAQRVTTTIDVDIRYQFSPAELLHRVERHGFKVLTLMPVHYHSMPVSLLHNKRVDEAHREVATFISRNFISHQQCVPYSSSFLLEARRV